MKGTRPLTNDEIRKVRDAFTGTFAPRNRGLFMLGVSIGGRVSELLSLTVGDVWQNNKPVTSFQFAKEIVKGGETARMIPVNTDGRKAIEEIVLWNHGAFGCGNKDGELSIAMPIQLPADHPLFPSRKRKKGKIMPMKRQAVHTILDQVFAAAELNGKLATHTMRKTFAQRLYQQCNDIYMVKELLGHKNVSTTQDYIGINYVSAQEAVEAMSLEAEDNPRDPLDEYAPEVLVAKVIALGYEVRKTDDT